jgi:hypothetical protein
MAAAPAPGAASLLAKASAAYEQNILQEKHWNWTSTEIYRVTLKGGDIVARLPSVTIESVIRSDGQRCSAVLRWDDGVEAHLAKGDAESRCAATSGDRSALDLTRILKSRRVTLVSETAEGITLAITPDKDLLHAPEIEVRCSASLRVTLLMDAATFFPRRVEGEVVESGCDRERVSASVYYGGKPPAWVRDSLTKALHFAWSTNCKRTSSRRPNVAFGSRSVSTTISHAGTMADMSYSGAADSKSGLLAKRNTSSRTWRPLRRSLAHALRFDR